jgi:hypothetical protein
MIFSVIFQLPPTRRSLSRYLATISVTALSSPASVWCDVW